MAIAKRSKQGIKACTTSNLQSWAHNPIGCISYLLSHNGYEGSVVVNITHGLSTLICALTQHTTHGEERLFNMPSRISDDYLIYYLFTLHIFSEQFYKTYQHCAEHLQVQLTLHRALQSSPIGLYIELNATLTGCRAYIRNTYALLPC
jgi:hypothetical protein